MQKGPDISIRENILIGSQGYQTVLYQFPQKGDSYFFEITPLKNQTIRVGISPNKYQDMNFLDYPCGMHPVSYSYRLTDGYIFNDGIGKPYGQEVKVKESIAISYDQEQRTLQYIFNGKSLGIAFSNIPDLEYYAAVSLFGHAEASIQLT
ncbi:Set1/Ash2 histone methyltransferase complex subunit ASH2 [Paramecium bursaria]